MSKKKSGSKGRKAESRPAPAPAGKDKISEPKVVRHGWDRLPPVEEQSPSYRNIFRWSALALLVLMWVFSLGSGINGDDSFQVDYSEKLVNFYTTMGADTSALYIENGKMHYYGGFFDLTTGLVNRALGFTELDASYHRVRHLFNATLGWLAILFSALLARLIAGNRAGILTLFLLFLSPRFLGHSLMNPKDIPFAAGFAITLYCLAVLLKKMPKPGWKPLVGLGLGIGMALGTRAGGLLAIGFVFLFGGLDFLIRQGFSGIWKQYRTFFVYAGALLGTAVAGYGLALLVWPAALVSPVKLPLEALTEFSSLGVRIRLLFAGENIMSDATPWYYPLAWMVRTIPLYALVGFSGGLILLPVLLRRYPVTPVLLVFFTAVFPVFYVIVKEAILHDGWRHLLFVYPSMVVGAALFWVTLEKWAFFFRSARARYALWAILGLMVLEPAIFIARNVHYPYVYFNPVAGGMKGAFGHYETDYWGVSVKQAIDWLEKEGILGDQMQDTVYLGTTFFYNVSRQLGRSYRDKVRVRYVRFNERYNEEWDYGIFPSRFYRGPHLRSGNWPNDKTIHVIRANGVPLVAIEKDLEHYAFQGEGAFKQQDYTQAVQFFDQETQMHPNNELGWLGLEKSYLNLGAFDQTITTGNKAMEIAPENESALYYRALAYLNKGDVNQAMLDFQEILRINEDNSGALYYLAVIYENRNEPDEALRYAQEAIRKNPRLQGAYLLVARILESRGDATNAALYRQAAEQIK